MKQVLLCVLFSFSSAAHAMDPNINLGALIHDAFALQYKSAEQLYPSYAERKEILTTTPKDLQSALVNVKSGQILKGEWATCKDFSVMSRNEYDELRRLNSHLNFPGFFSVNNPVAISLFFTANFGMRISEFEAVVALRNRHFEMDEVIDSNIGFFSDGVVQRLKDIESRNYSSLFNHGLDAPWSSKLTISVSNILECDNDTELIFLVGK